MKVSSDALLQAVYSDLAHVNESPESGWRGFSSRVLKETLLKKYQEGISNTDADSRALQLFLKVNQELLDSPRAPETMLDQYLLGELRSSLERFWFKDGIQGLVGSLHDLFLSGRAGPGSSIGAKENDFYTKLFSSNLSCTSPELYSSYMRSTESVPRWKAANEVRASHFGQPCYVRQSKLLFVPKRHDISRTICVEPNLNMFYQLGFAKILESRLRAVYAIDLSTQPDFNRELARLGSIDGSYSTIDLSSASDSLSIGVLRAILPRDFFSWLYALRTPSTQLPDGRVVQLRMISTMGNGFTFPLETIIFAAVLDAAYRLDGKRLKRNSESPGNFAVFGDDIICETSVTQKVLRLLFLLGFQVNTSKTFVEGPFRESCGSDYYNGREVRGVYIKTLASPQDRYVAINLLNDWSAKTGLHLSEAVQLLLKSVRRVLIPPHCGLDEGIHVSASMAQYRRDTNGSFSYLKYLPRMRRLRIHEDHLPRSYRGIFNPDGLLISFLGGYIRSHTITLRQRVTRYAMKRVVSPVWDDIPLTRSYRRFSFTRWETAVYLNLYK